MKKVKSSVIILLVVAIAALAVGIITTVSAIKAGNDYKEGMQAYNMFEDAQGTVIGDYAAKLSAKAFSDTQTAQVAKKKLYTNFAISLISFLIFGVSVGYGVIQINKKEEKKEE